MSQSLENNETVKFTKKDLYLNPDDQELSYRRRKDEEKSSLGFGQRKLLLTLVQFLTLFWNPNKVKKPIVVYAGAAPGNNISIVSKMFPEMEFHLYDPRSFKIKPDDKIKIYKQLFLDEDAKKWSGRSDIFFISDIRTADYTKEKDLDKNEEQIAKDMDMQKIWVNTIKPVYAHLKFRLPYTGGNRPNTVNYLNGYILKQPFAPPTSTESRLVPFNTFEEKEWSCQKYQSQMFHHNVIVRETIKYINPFTDFYEPIDNKELLNDWDSTAEGKILSDYLMKRTGKSSLSLVRSLSRTVTNKLSKRNLETRRLETKYTRRSRDNKNNNIKGSKFIKTKTPKPDFPKKSENSLASQIGL